MPDFDPPLERVYSPEEMKKNSELKAAAKRGREAYLAGTVPSDEGEDSRRRNAEAIADAARLVACDQFESL